MTKRDMLHIVQAQLAIDLACTVDQLNGEKDSFVFVQARDNPGCRPFPRGEQHFEMLTMGRAIVVSATPEILAIVTPALAGHNFCQGSLSNFLKNYKKTLPCGQECLWSVFYCILRFSINRLTSAIILRAELIPPTTVYHSAMGRPA